MTTAQFEFTFSTHALTSSFEFCLSYCTTCGYVIFLINNLNITIMHSIGMSQHRTQIETASFIHTSVVVEILIQIDTMMGTIPSMYTVNQQKLQQQNLEHCRKKKSSTFKQANDRLVLHILLTFILLYPCSFRYW